MSECRTGDKRRKYEEKYLFERDVAVRVLTSTGRVSPSKWRLKHSEGSIWCYLITNDDKVWESSSIDRSMSVPTS